MISDIALYLILFYCVVFLTQLFHYIASPSNKDRLHYLILLVTLTAYVFFSDLLPTEIVPLPTLIQVIIEWTVGFIMFTYLVYFVNSFLDLSELRSKFIKSGITYIFLPFVLFFVIPVLIWEDIIFIKRLFIIVPFSYAIWFLITVNKHVANNPKFKSTSQIKLKVFGTNLALISAIALGVSAFFGLESFYELLIANTGFVILSFTYLLILILDTQNDYKKLAENKKELLILNHTLQDKVEERTRELVLANEERTNAFISLTHETRTPITLIKNKLEEYVNTHTVSPELESIKYNVDKLEQQVTKVLDVEKSLKGNFSYRHDKVVNFSEFLSEKIKTFETYSKKKQIRLFCEIDKNIFIKIDISALDSLINNLIENAIKYTQASGTIWISLKIRDSKIEFKVKDNGLGIAQAYQRDIFKPYFHIPGPDDNKGVGIGLFVVENIVKSVNGKIKLSSTETKGTEFTITLNPSSEKDAFLFTSDLLKSPNLDNIGVNVDDAYVDNAKPSILIIEDNEDLLLYLRDTLKSNYNIYVALNGLLALRKLKEIPQKPDLIISDVMMDKMDGIKFYDSLKQTDFHYIPVIYITAKANSIDKHQALEMGAIDYIYKPFDINEVRSKVASIITNSKKQRDLALSTIQNIISSQKEGIWENENLPKAKDDFNSNCAFFNITQREKDVIILAKAGKTYIEIAEELFISKKTVDTHFQRIYKKVGVNSKQKLFESIFSPP